MARILRVVACCVVLVMLMGPGVIPVTAQDTSYHFRDDPISWSPCPDAPVDGLECAVYVVPLDYRQPDGETIELALRRMPAQAGNAQGVLFFNPGGPGGTASGQFPAWYAQFPAAVRDAYDIVSWDPRGIGESTQAQCFANGDEENAVLGSLGQFPLTYEDQQAWTDAYATFAEACASNAAGILAHISTADTARDLEQLRIASGDVPLNYWGVSYGTFLGATYANMFPDNIRTLVLDGNLSPLAWTADGDPDPQLTIGDRIGSQAVADVFQHFLQLCAAAGPTDCGFAAPSYSLTLQKWDALQDRLSQGPIVFETAAGVRLVTLSALIGQLSDGMDIVWPLPGSSGWAAIADVLQAIYEAGMATPAAPATPSAVASPASVEPAAYDGAEGVIGIMCGDAATPSLDRFPTLSSEVMLQSGYFGLSTSYVGFPCALWQIPAADPYAGPWDTQLGSAPLIVNTTHDPSTPMQNAEEMASLLPGSVLLRVNGYGHTTLLNQSTCANDLIADYIINEVLPAPNTWCAQDRQPFEA